MYLFITILILIVSVILILIVLIQNSKGGGLASGLSSSNQIMGAPKTADFLEKSTWTLAGVLLGLCIISSLVLSPHDNTAADKSELSGQIQNQATPGFEINETQSVPDAVNIPVDAQDDNN